MSFGALKSWTVYNIQHKISSFFIDNKLYI